MLNKGTTGTIFITSLIWRGPWLGIEPETSRTRSQHYTNRLSRGRSEYINTALSANHFKYFIWDGIKNLLKTSSVFLILLSVYLLIMSMYWYHFIMMFRNVLVSCISVLLVFVFCVWGPYGRIFTFVRWALYKINCGSFCMNRTTLCDLWLGGVW